MSENKNAAQEMIRATYTAPTLIGEGGSTPLLDRARSLVADDFPDAKERARRKRLGIVNPPR